MSEGQRVDVWLHRARFARTRAAAARLVAEGGLRLIRGGLARRLDKSAVDVAPGDSLVFALRGRMRALRVIALADRRGPPCEARRLYCEHDADPLA